MRVRLFPISSAQFSWFVFELFNSRDDGSCSNGSCSSCSSNCTSVAWERYINIKLMFSIRMLHKYRDTMWHLISECYHHVVFSARIICVQCQDFVWCLVSESYVVFSYRILCDVQCQNLMWYLVTGSYVVFNFRILNDVQFQNLMWCLISVLYCLKCQSLMWCLVCFQTTRKCRTENQAGMRHSNTPPTKRPVA